MDEQPEPARLPSGMRFSLAVKARMDALNLRNADVARAADRTPQTIARRLSTGTGWELEEARLVATLVGIPLHEVARIFELTSDRGEAELVLLERQVNLLQEENAQLRDGRYEPQSVIRDILRTGRWAVSLLPNMAGPTPDRKVIVSVRIAIASIDPALADATASELRSALTRDVPSVVKRAVWLSTNDLERPNVPGIRGEAQQQSLDISVIIFAESHPPAPVAQRTALRHRGRSVLVIGTSTGSWATEVSSLLAHSLGWGMQSMRALARLTPAPQGIEDGPTHRRWLRLEADRQLYNALLDPEREREMIYSHWGWNEILPDGSGQNALVRAIEASRDDPDFPELPYIVLLREEDKLLEYYADLPNTERVPSPPARVDRNIASRDALWQAVMSLPADHRLVIDLRRVDGGTAQERAQQTWMRSVQAAHQAIRALVEKGRTVRIKDRAAALLMDAVTSDVIERSSPL